MADSTTASTTSTGFVRAFSLVDAVMLVAGSMIGSGIFIVSADIARTLNSRLWLPIFVLWRRMSAGPPPTPA